jgi:hypothetical protein
MVTRLGDMILLDNVKLGVSKDETDESRVYLGFTDTDNAETYLVPIAKSKIESYFQLIKQEITKMGIEITSEMPGEG